MDSQTTFFRYDSLNSPMPRLVNFNDARNLVRLLKKKRDGFSLVEVTDIFLRRLFDPCKLTAYEECGLIENRNNIVSLSGLGLELADCTNAEVKVFQKIIRKIQPYQNVLEWMANQSKSLVLYTEVISYWKQNNPEILYDNDEKKNECFVITFFNLCHLAELGLATVGRKGQPTRLNVDHNSLSAFLSLKEKIELGETKILSNGQLNKNPNHSNGNGKSKTVSEKIFFSVDEKNEISNTVLSLFELSNISTEILVGVKSDLLLEEETAKTMKCCSSAVYLFNEKNIHLKNGELPDTVLSQIIAGYAVFEGRILLLWQGENLPKIRLPRLKIMSIKTDCLDWQTGFEIGRIIKQFKAEATVSNSF